MLALASTIGVSIILTGCGASTESRGDAVEQVSESQQELYKDAIKAGGEINFFVGTSSDDQNDQVVDRFKEQFPELTVKYVSGTGNEVTERLLTEKRAGLNNVDVLLVPGISTFDQVSAEGYLADFAPEDVDLFTGEGKAGTYIENQAYSFGGQYNGVCYNPNNVTDEEAALLKTYDGWTDPVWEGRAAIINANGSVYRRGLSYWLYQDDQLGQPWFDKLAAIHPTVFAGGNLVVPQVMSGEYDVVFNIATHYGVRAHRDGAPLQCVTGERAPYSTFAAGIVTDAPNEPGAELFTNWLFSESGQDAVQQSWAFVSMREGFDKPVIDADWWQLPEDPRVIDESVVNERYQDLVDTFTATFGAGK